MRYSLLIFLAWFTLAPSAFPADNDKVEGERTDQGFVVGKGSYVSIPDDMEMKRVTKNVIKAESQEAYLGRKFDSLEKTVEDQMTSLDSRWNERLVKIEEKLDRIEKNTAKDRHGVFRY